MEQKLKDCWKAEQHYCVYLYCPKCNCFQIILSKQSVVFFPHTKAITLALNVPRSSEMIASAY